jgi:uncharacterized protein YjbI with pentapeptide repeats
MAGFTAAELRMAHVSFSDCRLTESWLRMATLEHCAFEGCDLSGSDLYEATITGSRFLRSKLDGVELSKARLDGVAFHGTTVTGIAGADAFRRCTIGPDQVVDFALPVFASLGIVVDDIEDEPSSE